jgi:NADPH-dependent curcumin reductase CurA
MTKHAYVFTGATEGFPRLFRGGNFGKLLVKIAD